jgi:hypothetical protein
MMVPMTAYFWFWMSMMKVLEQLTLSSFCSWDSSFDNQWADVITRPSYLCRMWWIVPNDVIWTAVSYVIGILQPSSMAANTGVTNLLVLTIFLDVEDPLIIKIFSVFTFLPYFINVHPLEPLIPLHCFHHLFYFF